MRVVIEADSAAVGRRLADRIAEVLSHEPSAVIGVATGSSPQAGYSELARRVASGELDLSGASAFALDEYLGLPAGDPQSYAETVRRSVTVPLRLDPSRVHVPPGDEADPEAAHNYERAIAAAGGIDIQILGIGANGHLGFNEPGSPFDSRTRIVRLSDQTRRDNSRFFDSLTEVPTHAITQGLATILDARRLVLVASGASKARAVQRALRGPVSPDCPASILQLHADVTVVLDREAASGLEGWVATVPAQEQPA